MRVLDKQNERLCQPSYLEKLDDVIKILCSIEVFDYASNQSFQQASACVLFGQLTEVILKRFVIVIIDVVL